MTELLKSLKVRKVSCKDCHFLTAVQCPAGQRERKVTWTQEERENIQETLAKYEDLRPGPDGLETYWVTECFHQLWSNPTEVQLRKKRRCSSYMGYHKDKSVFEGNKVLEEGRRYRLFIFPVLFSMVALLVSMSSCSIALFTSPLMDIGPLLKAVFRQLGLW